MPDSLPCFTDLRTFIDHLEVAGELVRIKTEVDPNQEVTIIMHRVLAAGGPALLFENVKGSDYRLVTNLYGTKKRVDMLYGGSPAALGERVFALSEKVMPPTPGNLWNARKDLWDVMRARLRTVSHGPILDTISQPADISRLPVLTCWPEDGGAFFTLPLVHTEDPDNGRGNLGIYRLQRFDATSTGMHWQIEKGGGFHFSRAKELGQPLPVSVILGGAPALTIAAVSPLPEGIDERLLAAYMLGQPLDMIQRSTTGHRIPANAEFVLEGTVTPGDMQYEGPFGDHFGHYSHASDFPVFRIDRVLARRDAIFPATVVGQPVQEDFYIGIALQEMALPILKIIRPAIADLWAYPETGFHPLAVMGVHERYPREAMKHVLGMLGEGQVSLTKIMVAVGADVNVRDIRAVSAALWRHLDHAEGIHLIAPTAQDTLDFTGPAMNSGSRLILIATERDGNPVRTAPPPTLPTDLDARGVHKHINHLADLGGAFLLVQLSERSDTEGVRAALAEHALTRPYLFHVLLSDDVPLDDVTLALWGWFTRFDPLADLHPARREVVGNRLLMHFPIAIDATWKPGYPKPLTFDPEIEKRVNDRWNDYQIPL